MTATMPWHGGTSLMFLRWGGSPYWRLPMVLHTSKLVYACAYDYTCTRRLSCKRL